MGETDCPESGLKTPLKNITRDFYPLAAQVYLPWTKIFNGTLTIAQRMGCTDGFRRSF